MLEKSAVACSGEEKAAFAAEKNDLYRELLKQMSTADLAEEVKNTLNALRAQGLKLAIGFDCAAIGDARDDERADWHLNSFGELLSVG